MLQTNSGDSSWDLDVCECDLTTYCVQDGQCSKMGDVKIILLIKKYKKMLNKVNKINYHINTIGVDNL